MRRRAKIFHYIGLFAMFMSRKPANHEPRTISKNNQQNNLYTSRATSDNHIGWNGHAPVLGMANQKKFV